MGTFSAVFLFVNLRVFFFILKTEGPDKSLIKSANPIVTNQINLKIFWNLCKIFDNISTLLNTDGEKYFF